VGLPDLLEQGPPAHPVYTVGLPMTDIAAQLGLRV
jgi:hypothetical protein